MSVKSAEEISCQDARLLKMGEKISAVEELQHLVAGKVKDSLAALQELHASSGALQAQMESSLALEVCPHNLKNCLYLE